MPKKAAKGEPEKAPDLAEELPVWSEDELGAAVASGGAAYTEEGGEQLLPEALRGRVTEWLRPAEFSTGVEDAPPPAEEVLSQMVVFRKK